MLAAYCIHRAKARNAQLRDQTRASGRLLRSPRHVQSDMGVRVRSGLPRLLVSRRDVDEVRTESVEGLTDAERTTDRIIRMPLAVTRLRVQPGSVP